MTVQLIENEVVKDMDVWELDETRPVEEEPPKRKRQKKQSAADQDPAGNSPSVPPAQVPDDNTPEVQDANSKFYFNFYIGANGTILRIGSLYSLKFCSNSVFICTCISRNKGVYKFKFLLCSLVENKVEGVEGGVSFTANDVIHVSRHSDVVVGSKARNLVDKIICEGWERVLDCQVKNSGNVSYLLDLRKSCLASQIRQGVYSGISRNATRPAQPIHLGIFDPMYDSKILGLTSKNDFQVSYLGRDLAKLDSFLGAKWDFKILEPGNPCSHFKYVCKVRVFVHRQSMSLRLNFVYSESNTPFTVGYRSVCSY